MAANRIKGITIEIGGDTTKLDKALKGVNATIKDSQNKLRDLNRLLKLDPGNTNLLQQKFRTLQTDISATKDKLNTLKEASKQADKAMASGKMSQNEYDALQREIAETEIKLKSLTQEYINFGSVSAQQVAVAGKKMSEFGGNLTTAGQKFMPVSLAVAGVGAAALKTSVDFESAMAKVGAISNATEEDMVRLEEATRNMAKSTKFSASETADAMQYMALAGWDANAMIAGLPSVLNLAGASGEDLAMVCDIMTDNLSAFNMTADDAQRMADVLAVTMSSTNTNVEMLGEAFKYVAPTAGQMGYTLEDVSAGLGVMANNGIKASNSGTALRSVMSRLAKPTKESQIAMDALGISIDDGQGNMLSWVDVMKQIRSGMGGLKISSEELQTSLAEIETAFESGELSEKDYEKEIEKLTERAYGAEGALKAEYAAMLAGKTGMSGLLAIVGTSDEDFEKLTNTIYGASDAYNGLGAAQGMYNRMTDTMQGKMDILKSTLEELGIQLGQILIPIVEKVVAKLQEFANYIDSLDENQKEMIATIMLVVAALGPALIVIGKLMSSLGGLLQIVPKLVGTFTNLPTVLSMAFSPMTLIIGVIALLVAAFIHLWQTNDEFKQNILGTWGEIKDTFNEFGQGIVDRLNEMGFDFENFGEVVTAVWEGLCKFLGPVFIAVFKNIKVELKRVFDSILAIWDIFSSVFKGDWEGAWEGIKSLVNAKWEGIKGLIKNALEMIEKITGGKLTALNDKFKDKFERIKELIGNALQWISEKFASMQLKFPDIKVPHFSIDGELSLYPPKVPRISVDWYAKAMDKGMILNTPTIFGASGGKLLGAGEAGSETVVGTSSLMGMIQNAVGNTGIDTMVSLMSEYLPYLAQSTEIRLDSGALVGATANQMNVALGRISAREGRR